MTEYGRCFRCEAIDTMGDPERNSSRDACEHRLHATNQARTLDQISKSYALHSDWLPASRFFANFIASKKRTSMRVRTHTYLHTDAELYKKVITATRHTANHAIKFRYNNKRIHVCVLQVFGESVAGVGRDGAYAVLQKDMGFDFASLEQGHGYSRVCLYIDMCENILHSM